MSDGQFRCKVCGKDLFGLTGPPSAPPKYHFYKGWYYCLEHSPTGGVLSADTDSPDEQVADPYCAEGELLVWETRHVVYQSVPATTADEAERLAHEAIETTPGLYDVACAPGEVDYLRVGFGGDGM